MTCERCGASLRHGSRCEWCPKTTGTATANKGTSDTLNVHTCPRCTWGHQGLSVTALSRPLLMPENGATLTHWCTCPTGGQPILLRAGSVTPDQLIAY